MTWRRWGLLSVLAAIALLAVPAEAAADGPVVGHFSFGASLPQGKARDAVDDGWAFHGGATWFSMNHPNLGIRMDIGVDWFDAKGSFLNQIDTDPNTPGVQRPDNGYARAWSGTADILWGSSRQGGIGWYLVGGVGVYYTQAHLSQNGYGAGYICDPWWGWCYPGVVQGEYVIQSQSNWEWGLNAGAGVTFAAGSTTELYLEAVYHWIDTKHRSEVIPISLGVRW